MGALLVAALPAIGGVAALTLGAIDSLRVRRGEVPVEQPIGLLLLAVALAWLSFATWPR